MPEDHKTNPSPKFPATPGAIVRGLRDSEMPRRCPLTLEPMAAGDWVAECDSCHAVHRLTAWRENEGCSTLACRRAPNARRDHPDQVVRLGTGESTTTSATGRPSAGAETWPSDRIVIRFESSASTARPIVPPAEFGAPRGSPPIPSPPPPPPPPPPPAWSPARPSPPPMPSGAGQPTAAPFPGPFPGSGGASHARPLAKPGIRREARSDESARRCPYSMEQLRAGASVVECRSCGQVLIAIAWEENGGCTTYGCAGAPDFRKDQL